MCEIYFFVFAFVFGIGFGGMWNDDALQDWFSWCLTFSMAALWPVIAGIIFLSFVDDFVSWFIRPVIVIYQLTNREDLHTDC